MTVVLETQHVFGRTIVAALVASQIDEHHSANHVALNGSKGPQVVLIRDGSGISAFSLLGDPVALSEVEAQYPDAMAELLAVDLNGI